MALIVSIGLLIGGLLADAPGATELLLETSTMFAFAEGLCRIGDGIGKLGKRKSDNTETEK